MARFRGSSSGTQEVEFRLNKYQAPYQKISGPPDQKKKSHSVALRALAYKWIRIIFRMWKNREPYSEARYLKALQKAGSPLMKGF